MTSSRKDIPRKEQITIVDIHGTAIKVTCDVYALPDGPVVTMVWSPTSPYLAYVPRSRTAVAQVIDARKKGVAYEYRHAHTIKVLAWSPNGKRIALGMEDGIIALWRLEQRFSVCDLLYYVPGGDVHSLCWSPDGYEIIAGDDIGLHVYDARVRWSRTREGHHLYDTPLPPVQAVGWLHEGIQVAWANGHTLEVRGPLGLCQTKPTVSEITALAWMPDGRLLVAFTDGTIRIHDVTYRGHALADHMSAIAWSPDGHYVISCSNRQTLHLWDTTTGTTQISWQTNSPVVALAWSQIGGYVAWGTEAGDIHVMRFPGRVYEMINREIS